MNKVLLFCVLMLMVGCNSSELPADPAVLRAQADLIEDEQAKATAYAQANALERQNSTRAAATAVAFQITQDAAALTLAIEQDSITATAEWLKTKNAATMAAMVAEATATAVARTTEDAQTAALFQQEMDYERQQMQRELFNDYAKNALTWLLWLVVIILLVEVIIKILKSGRFVNPNNGPTVAQVEGATLLHDPSRAWTVMRPRALPEPEPLMMLPAPVIDLPTIHDGHVLIAGETGSGKSTAMRSVLAPRSNVTVLDPHAAPNDWQNANVIGGGRNFEAINEYMEYMRSVLSQRYSEREGGRRAFDSITVATDEMPAIVSALGKQIGDSWREWLREGRKVGLFFVVSTQSTRVVTLGIKGEGDLLENFAAVIELGKVARGNHPDLVSGQERPAVLTTVEGVRPVVIPHYPNQHQPQQTTTMLDVTPPALFDDPQVTGLETERGNVTADQFRKVKRLLDTNQYSGNEIQRRVWGYDGGNAYYYLNKIKQLISTSSEAA